MLVVPGIIGWKRRGTRGIFWYDDEYVYVYKKDWKVLIGRGGGGRATGSPGIPIPERRTEQEHAADGLILLNADSPGREGRKKTCSVYQHLLGLLSRGGVLFRSLSLGKGRSKGSGRADRWWSAGTHTHTHTHSQHFEPAGIRIAIDRRWERKSKQSSSLSSWSNDWNSSCCWASIMTRAAQQQLLLLGRAGAVRFDLYLVVVCLVVLLTWRICHHSGITNDPLSLSSWWRHLFYEPYGRSSLYFDSIPGFFQVFFFFK